MKHEIFYRLGNQINIGYFSDTEIEYLRKYTSIEILKVNEAQSSFICFYKKIIL